MAISTDFPLTAVAKLAQTEQETMNEQGLAICEVCYRPGGNEVNIRRCTGCKLVNYCGRDCQKSHWRKHKHFCYLVTGKGLKNAFLSSLDHPTAIDMIIDSYRLRVQNDHDHREEDHGIYFDPNSTQQTLEEDTANNRKPLVWARDDAVVDFQRYIDLAESARILPEWWDFDQRMECLSRAVDKEENPHATIFRKADTEKLIRKYGGDTAARQGLLVIAELIVGFDGRGAAEDNTWYEEAFLRALQDRPPPPAAAAAATTTTTTEKEGTS